MPVMHRFLRGNVQMADAAGKKIADPGRSERFLAKPEGRVRPRVGERDRVVVGAIKDLRQRCFFEAKPQKGCNGILPLALTEVPMGL